MIDLEGKKSELELQGMTDKAILQYSLKCSKEILSELKSRGNFEDYKELSKTIAEAEEIILNELMK